MPEQATATTPAAPLPPAPGSTTPPPPSATPPAAPGTPGHQPDAELQGKLTAAEQEASTWKGRTEAEILRAKNLEAENARLRVLAGEPETPKTPATPATPEFVPADRYERDRQRDTFERSNGTQMKLLSEEGKKLYEEKLAKGESFQDALDLALYRSGVTPGSRGPSNHQIPSSPPAGPDRSGGAVEGVSEDVMNRYAAQYPNLPRERLAQIIREQTGRAADPDQGPSW